VGRSWGFCIKIYHFGKRGASGGVLWTQESIKPFFAKSGVVINPDYQIWCGALLAFAA